MGCGAGGSKRKASQRRMHSEESGNASVCVKGAGAREATMRCARFKVVHGHPRGGAWTAEVQWQRAF